MRLGYNTNGLQNHRLADALRLLADHGYEVVALTPDTCHLDPLRATVREVEEIAALLARLRLGVVIETGARFVLDPAVKHEPTLMTRALERRRQRLDFYSSCARMGRDLGARVVSFWAGIDRDPGPDSWSWLCEGVAAACERIRQVGLDPSFEPEPGMAIETVGGFRELARALGEGAPALTLDIGHLYAVWEGEPDAVIRQIGPCLRQVHLEDMRRENHEHLLPGAGDVDFSVALSALEEAAYDGPVCFELSRHSHLAPATLKACREVFDRSRPRPRS